jgi:hypothetical protein
MEAQGGEKMYSSYLFTTSALDAGEWLASRPGPSLLLPEKGPPVPVVQEAGWAPDLNSLALLSKDRIYSLFHID